MSRVIYMCTSILTIGLLVLISCKVKQPNNDKADILSNIISGTEEVITRTFSVKEESGEYVKDSVTSIQSITYNGDGTESGNNYYNLDGTLNWRDEYSYDDTGVRTGSRFYENGVVTSHYIYDLDSLGRKVGFQALEIKTDTLLYDGASRYEEDGLIRKDGYIDESGTFRWNFEYQYDKDGNELGYVYIDLANGERYPSVYRYVNHNDQGMWTERQILENQIIQVIETREFNNKQ